MAPRPSTRSAKVPTVPDKAPPVKKTHKKSKKAPKPVSKDAGGELGDHVSDLETSVNQTNILAATVLSKLNQVYPDAPQQDASAPIVVPAANPPNHQPLLIGGGKAVTRSRASLSRLGPYDAPTTALSPASTAAASRDASRPLNVPDSTRPTSDYNLLNAAAPSAIPGSALPGPSQYNCSTNIRHKR